MPNTKWGTIDIRRAVPPPFFPPKQQKRYKNIQVGKDLYNVYMLVNCFVDGTGKYPYMKDMKELDDRRHEYSVAMKL